MVHVQKWGGLVEVEGFHWLCRGVPALSGEKL
ncbi:hypothetical protein SAMN05421783_1466 [Thiocapsa roseopersicina]|uniref:Uncharacterized protein n=1 Tax=Thiocapsa roseopersicina TaxID=1058 RepID=A0A1H3DBV4_THIRO|nr:hypothetical protein SAMN05421783_1466 [Thiocapsa roseopersicina]